MSKLESLDGIDHAACSLSAADDSFFDKLPGKKAFNVRAVRARVGIVNLLVGIALASHLFNPEAPTVLYLSAYLSLDMLMAVVFGFPLCPTGMIASLMTVRHPFVSTPHLPKRFARSMGMSLALVLVTLYLTGSENYWITLVLLVFFTLSWLDAVLGFCMGCWIYSGLFDCKSCRSN